MVLSLMERKNQIDYTGYFGDKRLEKRGNSITEEMIHKKTVILNRLADNRAELVGSCRFFENDAVTKESLIHEAILRCSNIIDGQHVLAIQDSSEMNYQHHAGKLSREDKELGPVGNNTNIGFFLHPVFVLDAHDGFPLGFSDIHIWNRQWDKQTKYERQYHKLAIEDKESYRWIDSSLKSKEILANASCITMIADREADIYEEFIAVPDGKTHFIVRSTQNRILSDTDEKLFEHLSRLACAGTFTLDVKSSQKKRQAREAKIEVRFNKVQIAKPKRHGKDDYAAYVELYAIEAKEHWSTVPPGEDPICWKLLTTHEVKSMLEARQILTWYSFRWQIEQLFRTLKRQGLHVESSQLESGQGLKKLVLLALNAALKIMQLTQERDGKSGKPSSIVFNMEELAFLQVLLHVYEGKTEKQKNPHQEHSLAWAAWIIARIGGWKGYLKASPPGPITMKRGLEIFTQLFRGWLLHADVCIE